MVLVSHVFHFAVVSMVCGYHPAFRQKMALDFLPSLVKANRQPVGVFIQEAAQLLFNNVNAV